MPLFQLWEHSIKLLSRIGDLMDVSIDANDISMRAGWQLEGWRTQCTTWYILESKLGMVVLRSFLAQSKTFEMDM